MPKIFGSSAAGGISGGHIERCATNMAKEYKLSPQRLKALQDEMETMNSWFTGPAAAAYQSHMEEEIENAMSVCTYLTEYMNCIEQASRAYTECEQSVAGVVNRIRI